jgi:hypothetical protein
MLGCLSATTAELHARVAGAETDDMWRAFSVRRWGPAVLAVAQEEAAASAFADAADASTASGTSAAACNSTAVVSSTVKKPHRSGSGVLEACAGASSSASSAATAVNRAAIAAPGCLTVAPKPIAVEAGLAAMGGAATAGAARRPLPWRAYYTFRCSVWDAPPSPLGLIQERYARDPWRLLAACLLCSRTSGSAVVHATVAAFFAAYPTPSSVLEAAATPGGLAVLGALLHPLGLHREAVLPRTARGFLSQGWTGGDGVRQLYGCGAFTHDSWRVFCLGHAAAVARDKDADRNVRAYASWAVANAKRSSSAIGSGRSGRGGDSDVEHQAASGKGGRDIP